LRIEHHVKAKVTVATAEQSWLGRLFSVDALNMLGPSILEAVRGGTTEKAVT
jgi:hypothetical protein